MSKLNKNRRKIIDFIKSYNEPVNARVIAQYFKNEMDQATVYRNLNYLEKPSLHLNFASV